MPIIITKSINSMYWGRMTHTCFSKLTISGSNNGLSPGRHLAIIWTNAKILLTGSSGTKFSEIWIEIHTFPFRKMDLKMSTGKWRTFCLGLNVLMDHGLQLIACNSAMYVDWLHMYMFAYIQVMRDGMARKVSNEMYTSTGAKWLSDITHPDITHPDKPHPDN